MRIRKALISALAIAVMMSVTPAQASLQNTMDNIFNSMCNVSRPGVYEGIRRGVIAGGQVAVRNRIVNQNVLSFVPPSWKAGCGGIDLFGGSFSMINSEQMVQLLRAVASNAAAYAFSLALETISPPIAEAVKFWTKWVNDVNRYLGNSCLLAQKAVDSVRGFGAKALNLETSMQNSAVAAGNAQDNFFALPPQSDAIDLAKDTNGAKQVLGNLVWRALKSQNVKTWFVGGDDHAYEEMMSLTGTYIVATGAKVDDRTPVDIQARGSILSLKDLVEGGNNIKIFRCLNGDSNIEKDCIEVEQQSTTIIPISQRIEEILVGNNPDAIGGLVHKIHNGQEPTDQELNLLASLNGSASGFLGKMIRDLAVRNESLAAGFVRNHSKTISIEVTARMGTEIFQAVYEALSTLNSPLVSEMVDKLQARSTSFKNEAHDLYAKYGKPTDMQATYHSYMGDLTPRDDLEKTTAVSFPVKK